MDNFTNTEWSKFYAGYKELDQKQLQKKILHFDKQKDAMLRDMSSPYKRMTHIRHIHYKTGIELPAFSKDGTKWLEYTTPFTNYMQMMLPQLGEVRTEYLTRKEQHDNLRKQKKVEKIMCERCHCMVSRTNLSKHVATKKCQECV